MNKNGLALFMVLGVIMLVILAANTILNVILNQTRLTHHESSRIQAFYATKGAMYYTLEQIRLGTSGWGPGTSHTFCRSGCNVNDTDFPSSLINIQADIGDLASGINGTQLINISANYTYY